MDNATTKQLVPTDFPVPLRHMPDPPPRLFVRSRGNPFTQLADLMNRPRLAVVGTRAVSTYGTIMVRKLVSELTARGVVIISGLALGVDRLAHQACLEAGGITIAVLPSSVEHVHPRSHTQLAQEILENGGLLISEYASSSIPYKLNFVARNRIVTALSDGLLIIEATRDSGTLHTARFALEQGIEVMAVPGNATSPTSEGTNTLIKTAATPVTESRDVLRVLGLPLSVRSKPIVTGNNGDEQRIIELLQQGITDGNELLAGSELSAQQFNHHLTMLEISAKIRPLGGNQWAIT